MNHAVLKLETVAKHIQKVSKIKVGGNGELLLELHAESLVALRKTS
jgi:hypothetical protein